MDRGRHHGPPVLVDSQAQLSPLLPGRGSMYTGTATREDKTAAWDRSQSSHSRCDIEDRSNIDLESSGKGNMKRGTACRTGNAPALKRACHVAISRGGAAVPFAPSPAACHPGPQTMYDRSDFPVQCEQSESHPMFAVRTSNSLSDQPPASCSGGCRASKQASPLSCSAYAGAVPCGPTTKGSVVNKAGASGTNCFDGPQSPST